MKRQYLSRILWGWLDLVITHLKLLIRVISIVKIVDFLLVAILCPRTLKKPTYSYAVYISPTLEVKAFHVSVTIRLLTNHIDYVILGIDIQQIEGWRGILMLVWRVKGFTLRFPDCERLLHLPPASL
jgi:hypothetical protein